MCLLLNPILRRPKHHFCGIPAKDAQAESDYEKKKKKQTQQKTQIKGHSLKQLSSTVQKYQGQERQTEELVQKSKN